MTPINLGDARAEHDSARLDNAFYESADYRTLIESDTKSIVVGRRGVGKSALFLKLDKYYQASGKIQVLKFAPDEHDVIAFRSISKFFANNPRLIRAATRLAFRFGLLMEIAEALSTRFKFKQAPSSNELTHYLQKWKSGKGILTRVRTLIESTVAREQDPEARVGAIATESGLSEVESLVSALLKEMKTSIAILVDRLDEGYEPDDVGVGVVAGFMHAAIDLKDRIDVTRTIVFLRDNIFRAVENFDQDFSRNLEQAVLRLHWDERSLLNFVASRIRSATSVKTEKSIRLWDQVTLGSLQGEVGFHSCLRMTLYRPRDLLLLLNEAFINAAKRDSFAIEPQDLEASAKSISESRLRDLVKEYDAQLPGLDRLTKAFWNGPPIYRLSDVSDLILGVIRKDDYCAPEQQQYAIFADAIDAVRALYSVGFVGIKEEGSEATVFCHDGRRPDRDFTEVDEIMVHPCYWMALNLTKRELHEDAASAINDEYDVRVKSETPELRRKSLGQLESELNGIAIGAGGAYAFEEWCFRVIRILFSGGLRNIVLHPNRIGLQRRDIVGTNHGSTAFWGRVLKTYDSSQVVFEVKNFSELDRDAFFQINSYLSREYGRIAFFITRRVDLNLQKGRELAWVRELRNQHDKIAIILSARFLVSLLQKIRNPSKHDAAEEALDKLLDQYLRNYFGETANRKRH